MHLPALSATLRRTETSPPTRWTKASALGKRLRATAFGARPEAALFIVTRPWRLSEMILTARMRLPPAAFVLRVVHRAKVALRLRFAALMLAPLLPIHGRPTEALAAMSGTLLRITATCIGRIHGAWATALRRAHRPTLPIPLGLCITLRLRAITRRTRPIRAALRRTQDVRPWTIPFSRFSGTRQVKRGRSRRGIHFGCCGRRWRCGGRLACRLSILSLQ